MKKLSLVLLLGLMLGAVLTGCKPKEEGTSTTTTDTNAPASTNAAPPANP